MTFTVKLHRRLAVAAALSGAVAAAVTGCTQEPEGARPRASGSIGSGLAATSTPSPRPAQPLSSADSKSIDDARELADQACAVLQRSGMEFEKLPDAYAQATVLADRAAAADPSWQDLVVAIHNSDESLITGKWGANSDEDFFRYQRAGVVLHQHCKELGHPLLDEHGAGSNEAS